MLVDVILVAMVGVLLFVLAMSAVVAIRDRTSKEARAAALKLYLPVLRTIQIATPVIVATVLVRAYGPELLHVLPPGFLGGTSP